VIVTCEPAGVGAAAPGTDSPITAAVQAVF
jgi:hypothetical protein